MDCEVSVVDDLITRAIVEAVARGAGKVASAPLDAAAEALKSRMGRRLDNTRAAAEAKAGGRPLDVGDRIASKALSEATVADDSVIADYLGGVLASSNQNDSGAAIVALIGRLSSLQLRLHYIFYREMRRVWSGAPLNLYESDKASSVTLTVPTTELMRALGTSDSDAVGSAIAVLWREGLIGEAWYFSRETESDPSSHGARVSPTGLGAEFFLWGHGVRPIDAKLLLSATTPLVFLTDVLQTPSASLRR